VDGLGRDAAVGGVDGHAGDVPRPGGVTPVGLVLHDLDQAAAVADELVLLDEGRVRRHGPAAEVLDAALLSEVYGILGVTSGAGLGAILVLTLVPAAGTWSITVAAFTGAACSGSRPAGGWSPTAWC
jgi:hypothetical protein